jgi:hypothetical protein
MVDPLALAMSKKYVVVEEGNELQNWGIGSSVL